MKYEKILEEREHMKKLVEKWLETNEPSIKLKDNDDWDKHNDNRAARTFTDIRG